MNQIFFSQNCCDRKSTYNLLQPNFSVFDIKNQQSAKWLDFESQILSIPPINFLFNIFKIQKQQRRRRQKPFLFIYYYIFFRFLINFKPPIYGRDNRTHIFIVYNDRKKYIHKKGTK